MKASGEGVFFNNRNLRPGVFKQGMYKYRGRKSRRKRCWKFDGGIIVTEENNR